MAFIDDVIVRTETKEGHDEIVAEIIRRLEENDLYVKLEKYKWKVRVVGFFGSGNRTRRNKDGRRVGERSIKMANIKVCQRCTEIPRIGELLSPVY